MITGCYTIVVLWLNKYLLAFFPQYHNHFFIQSYVLCNKCSKNQILNLVIKSYLLQLLLIHIDKNLLNRETHKLNKFDSLFLFTFYIHSRKKWYVHRMTEIYSQFFFQHANTKTKWIKLAINYNIKTDNLTKLIWWCIN